MATFTNTITSSSTMAQVATLLTAWAASLNGSINNDNFDTSTFSADVANISDAADTKGFTLTGNVACDAGVTFDTVDVSEIAQTVTNLQSTVEDDVVTKAGRITMVGGPVETGTDLYDVFTTEYPLYSTSTHDLEYSIIGFNFNPTVDSNGLGNMWAYMDNSTVTVGALTEEGASGTAVPSANAKAYYKITAIEK